MTPKIKNAIIFLVIALIFVLIYVFFVNKGPETDTLVSSISPSVPNVPAGTENSLVGGDFLSLLLNVKNIRLNDAIFSDVAFMSLKDSSITLIPDGNEGRSNPFAPIGVDTEEPISIPNPATQKESPSPSPSSSGLESESELDLLDQLSTEIESTTIDFSAP